VVHAAIRRKWHAVNARLFNGFRRRQPVHRTEAFLRKGWQRPVERLVLIPDHIRPNLPVWPRPVPLLADVHGEIEHDRNRWQIVLSGQADEVLPRTRLHIRGINDCEFEKFQALRNDEVQHFEGRARRCLVGWIVGDERPAMIGGDHLGRPEVARREGGFPRPRHANKNDERRIRDAQNSTRTKLRHGTIMPRLNQVMW
jgi:hypothetical protein